MPASQVRVCVCVKRGRVLLENKIGSYFWRVSEFFKVVRRFKKA
jgi:hypothetical protein